MSRVDMKSSTWMWLIALSGTFSCVAAGCATGGGGTAVTDDGNITETTTTAGGMGGSGGVGGVLVTASTTTTTTGGMGGAGGEDLSCTEDPCKITLPQCGCPSGDKCTLIPSATWPRGCYEAGDGVHGEVCSTDSDCVEGTFCRSYGGHRVCRDFCQSNADCVAPGGLCNVSVAGTAAEQLCSDNCDPITNMGCPVAGSKCEVLLDQSMNWHTLCLAAGAGTQGASCNTIDDCAPTFGCLDVNNVESCHQYCDIDNPACTIGTCIPFSTPLFIGTKQYGGCN